MTDHDVNPAPPAPRVPVRGGGTFPVHRIYCVGRNFADHAKEMGATAPASKAERGQPVFFLKPADAIVTDGVVPYPPGTQDLHHEVELVVALGRDATPGVIAPADAQRSEEHTSELQSLMRISYAVFCLKKKNKPT